MARGFTALVLTTVLAASSLARADAATCTATLGKEIGKYIKLRQKTIAKCEDARSKDSLPATTVCRPQCDPSSTNAGAPCRDAADCIGATPSCLPVSDAATSDKLAKTATKTTTKITAACTDPLPAVGFACDGAADAPASLAACITGPVQDTGVTELTERCATAEPPTNGCARIIPGVNVNAAVNVDTLAETIYDATAPVSDNGLQKCQSAIGKATGKYLSARYKALQKCNENIAAGKISGPCPDADAASAFEAARAKLDADIRKRCSETQLAADTPPDLTFGFPCESYKLTTFKREGTTNDNSIPVLDRFIPCIAEATATVADNMLNIAYPGNETSGFAEGVAAGDATDTAVIFWTRLPDATQGASLDVSTDPTFASGTQTVDIAAPDPNDDGTVKHEISLLTPATVYYYRFRQGGDTSATGKVKTAPAPTDTATVRVGWTGDAHSLYRPYTVLEPIRLLEPDAWFYIGDTIYADDPRADGVSAHALADYYFKYRDNRADASLRHLMASMGTYTMWDDHEVRNDFAGAVPAFATRMARGNHAFLRYNPIRENGGDPTRLYRSFKLGTLAEFFVIDLRQYRSAKYTCCNDPAEDGFVLVDADSTCTTSDDAALPSSACSAALATPGRTVLGAAQKAWLEDALSTSTATFKFIMNGPPITNLAFQPYDFWIGYPEERDAILDFIVSNALPNVIWLSTDLHGIVISAERVSVGPSQPVPEVVAGAIGMDPIFRLLPGSIGPLLGTLPALLAQITQYDIDRFNAVLLTVSPGSPATAKLDFYDRSGAIIGSITFNATP